MYATPLTYMYQGFTGSTDRHHTLTHTQSHSTHTKHTHTLSLTHTHTHSLSHTHQTHTHTHTLSHIHTHSEYMYQAIIQFAYFISCKKDLETVERGCRLFISQFPLSTDNQLPVDQLRHSTIGWIRWVGVAHPNSHPSNTCILIKAKHTVAIVQLLSMDDA